MSSLDCELYRDYMKKKIMVPRYKIMRKSPWNHKIIFPLWPSMAFELKYHSQFWVGSKRKMERRAGISNAGLSGLCDVFKGSKVILSEENT